MNREDIKVGDRLFYRPPTYVKRGWPGVELTVVRLVGGWVYAAYPSGETTRVHPRHLSPRAIDGTAPGESV